MTKADKLVSGSRLKVADLKQVHIEDNFFSRYTKLVQSAIIPYQWAALNDALPDTEPSYSIENFRRAAGLAEGEFRGFVFQDSDVAKWLEAVGFSLMTESNPEIEKQADEVIELIGKAQQPDGYLNTHFTLNAPDKRWKNLTDCHELYVAGHFIEAATAYYEATGKRALLDIVCRFADLICDTFGTGDGQIPAYDGHEEIELALVKLWQTTGEDRYLKQAKYFVDQRGQEPNYLLGEHKQDDFYDYYGNKGHQPILEYFQAHKPVREMDVAEGHAVRAVYLYSGMADVAAYTGDQQLLDSAIRLFDNIVQKQLYITGSIGQSCHLERFTVDYDLQNDANYSETCASIGLAMLALRLGQITGEGRFHDIVEMALYNTVLAGISQDGKRFFYVNPMEVWPHNCLPHTSRAAVKPERQPWFGCACCPPNVARTLAGLGQYVYGISEDTVFLQQFVANQSTLQVKGQSVHVIVEGSYPWEHQLTFRSDSPLPYKLAVRKPSWSRYLKLNGQAFEATDGFVSIDVPEGEYELTIDLDIRPRFNAAHPEVRADRGKVALSFGPLTYCLEEIDNGSNLSTLLVDVQSALKDGSIQLAKKNELGSYLEITVPGFRETYPVWSADALYRSVEDKKAEPKLESVTLRFLPYAYWGNRKAGEMAVWVRRA